MEDHEIEEILIRAKDRVSNASLEGNLITTKEALDFLQISHMTLKRYVKGGKIKRYKRGLSNSNWYMENEVMLLKAERECVHGKLSY